MVKLLLNWSTGPLVPYKCHLSPRKNTPKPQWIRRLYPWKPNSANSVLYPAKPHSLIRELTIWYGGVYMQLIQ